MKIVIIASYAPSIINFRKELILALRQSNEVTIFAPYEDEQTSKAILALGVEYKTFFLSLRGRNPFHDLKTKRELIQLLKKISPDVVLSYTIKPVVWGSIAAQKAGIKSIYSMITGLGYAFTDNHTVKSYLIQKIAIRLYKKALWNNETIFFQNTDDLNLFQRLQIILQNKKTLILNGSGVNLCHYAFLSPPTKPVSFLMIARLLKDKGIVEYVDAAQKVKQRYPETQFHLVGYIDSNPSAISQDLLDKWLSQKIITYHGKLLDVRPVIQATSVYVLPSYREGTPRSVLEAMSIGRPIITTDVPGCRETVIDQYNGFLVPVKNADALADAMKKMIENPELIATMGTASRELAERKYNVHNVNQVILKAMNLV